MRWPVAVAAGVVGVLAASGCGGSGSDDDSASSAPSPSPTTAASPSASADTGGASGGSASGAGELEGSWVTTSADGKVVALIVTGAEAGLFATGGTVCGGTAGEADGERVISLECTDGGDDRAAGTVGSVSATTLEVIWDGTLGTETYTKTEGGQLPSGLPTPGPGQ
ncbi:hypothetical protein ABZX40_31085 [Streptomyces sp. NPDC004610]|uniref:hypothetical protein n=1 Tax=unclassified Streptomyces TaxID=2593676 RepID=UPI0033A39683